ncbi:MarR family winged helix-turn-helix transcriptional regulator [Fulvivirga lutea]|uniref:Winged helix-turn-helix transcriptional regulator n=1 Tax=Fulvivirga lutea TaxID=2810512 RepID=A0A974ZZN8_9BACT|nr:MarR family winged helix-turn-helix transcriptional regulator [Fulvivirga lutea]QSE96340.1 winged helix-turn-helix transcriptional regulator [Fulvivirga lutea]
MKNIFDLDHQSNNVSAKVYASLEKIHDLIKGYQWETAKNYKLSPLQLNILLFIEHHDKSLCKPAQLAKEFMVSKPTITETLHTLIKKKLVVKEKDKIDTRSSFIRLTKEGEKLNKELNKYPNVLVNAIQQLKNDDQENLLKSNLLLLNQLVSTEKVIPERNCFTCFHYVGNKDDTHKCSLLKKQLETKNLRVDCPEHSTV